jgi:uncharacterized protein YcaQ
MDAKMHRKTGVLDVISLWLQDGVKPGVTWQKGCFRRLTILPAGRGPRVTLGRYPEGLFTDAMAGK